MNTDDKKQLHEQAPCERLADRSSPDPRSSAPADVEHTNSVARGDIDATVQVVGVFVNGLFVLAISFGLLDPRRLPPSAIPLFLAVVAAMWGAGVWLIVSRRRRKRAAAESGRPLLASRGNAGAVIIASITVIALELLTIGVIVGIRLAPLTHL